MLMFHHHGMKRKMYQLGTIRQFICMGEATVLNEQETIDGLKTLLTKYEQNRENPVLWDNLAENTQMQAKAIVGFKVKIKR